MKNIRLIEIELHNQCNRKCLWCPNSFIDRDIYEELKEDIYIETLEQLKDINYNGVISYSRYNEPMMNIRLLKERTRQAKEILPNVKLVTNTNGDFLCKDNLKDLMIDELTIMDYDNAGSDKCLHKLIDSCVEIDKIEYPFIYGHYKTIKILYYVDWLKHAKIEDRGGSLEGYSTERRSKPCMEPTYFTGIDFNGSVMPCCHMRSDNIKHKVYVLGNIYKNRLEDIYEMSTTCTLQAIAASTDNILSPCTYCTKGLGRYTRDKESINY